MRLHLLFRTVLIAPGDKPQVTFVNVPLADGFGKSEVMDLRSCGQGGILLISKSNLAYHLVTQSGWVLETVVCGQRLGMLFLHSLFLFCLLQWRLQCPVEYGKTFQYRC